MNRQDKYRRYVEIGKVAVRQGAAIAAEVAAKVSTEAMRQARIAKPIVQEAARRGTAMTAEMSRQIWSVLHAAARQVLVRVAPALQLWMRNRSLWGKAGLACAAGLLGIFVFAGMQSEKTVDRDEAPSFVQVATPKSEDDVTNVQPVIEKPVAEDPVSEEHVQQPRRRVTLSGLTGMQQPQRPASSLHEKELAQRRQQAQLQLEQAAAEYDSAVQQWNAEVAACQQNSPPPGYTSHQMGQLRAMGYRPQPRQPNQALLYAAQQAEQRFLQARNNWQRVSQDH